MQKVVVVFSCFLLLMFMTTSCGSAKLSSIENSVDISDYADDESVQLIKERYINGLWDSAITYTVDEINAAMVKTDVYVYFDNVEYDKEEPSYFHAKDHLIETFDYLIISGREQVGNNPEIRDTAIKSINYWIDNDFQCETNWYGNVITIPRLLSNVALLIDAEDYLEPNRVKKMFGIIRRGIITDEMDIGSSDGGPSNMAEYLDTTLKLGLISNDAKLLQKVSSDAGRIISIKEWGEVGIQDDLSYYTYRGVLDLSYSRVFIRNVVRLISLLYGTEYAVDNDKVYLLIDYILDGERYFHRNDGTVNFAIGRSAVYSNGGVLSCMSA